MTLRQHAGYNLTPKQRAFAEVYLQTGGNAPEAAMRVYNCSTRGSARVMAHKNLNNPKVLAYLDQLIGFTFDRETLDKVVDYLHGALTAEKPLMYRGEVVDFYPDWNAQLKACVQVFKIIGAYG